MKPRFLMALPLAAGALTAFMRGAPVAPAGPAASPDPQIQQIVDGISAANIEADINKLVSFRTRHTLSDAASPTTGIGAARNWIKGEFDRFSRESGGRLQVASDSYVQPPGERISRAVEIVDVVATLPGRDPASRGRIYVVSGHYDSRVTDIMNANSFEPGADDDGSGVAAVLEMARVMSRHEFDATIVFMAVAGEEQDLYGSTHWAEQARQRHLDIAGMLDNDIIGSSHDEHGGSHRHVVRLFAEGVPAVPEMSAGLRRRVATGGENDSAARELARRIVATAGRYVPAMRVELVYRTDRYLRGGDQIPFLERGWPAVRFTEAAEDFRHQHQDVRVENGVQYGDLPEFVDFGYNADVARVNAAALAELALAPAVPREVKIETVELENDTTLHWAPNAEPDLAGYAVVWRDTTAPFWQHREFAGNVTRHTVKGVSKDNVIFGVEAVDRAGHASPAAYPEPWRGK